MFEAGEGCAFAIVLRDSGKLVGSVALSTSARFQRAELGYWIGKPYQNNGYATEASEAVLEYGFLSLNLNRIHASHMRRNPASGRVMEKLGMSREGCLRQHAERDGIFEDLEVYGLLRSEWERTARAISGREP
jgi:RimJ/RimL family protein N-acetyltransferase